ncbi:hypothetical protein [Pigmentiphaga litoralis]|uniref:Uncharacterized protein n=1 Tax=Pigmentiphaga litoralis TaxID=516702 RepID=A0A7Y9IYS6_9BURK|nr:hypothetical protein [Pigmentiphaga litoralis]NYE25788.1 hypothetical protein [Pigmentiphaga litoralis]NYE84908.1 hypothetical protein [Pigmentiphaga litoralis]
MTFVSRTVNGLLLSMVTAVTAMAGASFSTVAEAADATLIGSADGASFTVGGTPYQVVTRARAERGSADPAARAAGSAAGTAGAVTVGTIGDYTITLPATGSTAAASGAVAPQSAPSSSPTSDYLVAVNRRTGSPVLVSNHLKLFGVSTAQAASVASSTGGAVDSLIAAASMAMLVYPSPAAALAAKTAIESQQGSGQGGGQAAIRVEPEVIQAFKTPR